MSDDWFSELAEGGQEASDFSTISERLFWLVARGDPDLGERRKALLDVLHDLRRTSIDAHKELGEAMGPEKWDVRHRISEALSDTAVTAAYLIGMLEEREGQTALQIVRPAGSRRSIDWPNRAERYLTENRAARLVERLVSMGHQKSFAVLTVADKRGVARDRIYAGLKRRAEARDILPDASEREILSLIFG